MQGRLNSGESLQGIGERDRKGGWRGREGW